MFRFRFRFSFTASLGVDIPIAFPSSRRAWELLVGASILSGLIADLLTILFAVYPG